MATYKVRVEKVVTGYLEIEAEGVPAALREAHATLDRFPPGQLEGFIDWKREPARYKVFGRHSEDGVVEQPGK